MNTLDNKICEIQQRSRLNQNVIINAQGLRIGRKFWIEGNLLPKSIQKSNISFCLTLRDNVQLGDILCQISNDRSLLSGTTDKVTINGTPLTTRYNRILLIAADMQGKRRFVNPPLGLERIAAYLRHINDSADVEVFDPNLHNNNNCQALMKLINDSVKENRPYDLIGFSSLTPTMKNDIGNINIINNFYKNNGLDRPVFIMGNSAVLLGGKKIFDALPPIDALVWGPGEYPLATILTCLQKLRSEDHNLSGEQLRQAVLMDALNNAKNYLPSLLAIRGQESYPESRPAVTVDQLTELQLILDYYAIPLDKYWSTYRRFITKDIIFHISTSSCPFACIYCATPKGKLGFMPTEKVAEMFKHARLAYPEITYFSFTDDNIFINHRKGNTYYLEALVKAIRQSGAWNSKMTFYFQARASNIAKLETYSGQKPDDFLMFLSNNGFKDVALGIESFSDKTLRELNKGIDPETNLSAINTLMRNNFNLIVNLILFPPNTTIKDLYITLKTAIELSVNPKVDIDPNFALHAFSGAPLTEKLIPDGIKEVMNRPNCKEALEKDWIKGTEVTYDSIESLLIPKDFAIKRGAIAQLHNEAIKLSANALKKTGIDPNEYGKRGLMIAWSIIALINKNFKYFNNLNAGEETIEYTAKFAELPIVFEETIKHRFPKEGKEWLGILNEIEVPTLI